MKFERVKGSITAMITPFQKDGSVNFDALTAQIERQIAAGTAPRRRCESGSPAARTVPSSGQDAKAGRNAVLVRQPYVQRLLVAVVQLGIGAVLLHNKHVHPQLQQTVQLLIAQFLKALGEQLQHDARLLPQNHFLLAE